MWYIIAVYIRRFVSSRSPGCNPGTLLEFHYSCPQSYQGNKNPGIVDKFKSLRNQKTILVVLVLKEWMHAIFLLMLIADLGPTSIGDLAIAVTTACNHSTGIVTKVSPNSEHWWRLWREGHWPKLISILHTHQWWATIPFGVYSCNWTGPGRLHRCNGSHSKALNRIFFDHSIISIIR